MEVYGNEKGNPDVSQMPMNQAHIPEAAQQMQFQQTGIKPPQYFTRTNTVTSNPPQFITPTTTASTYAPQKPSRFQNATPLLALNRSEAPVDCPMCGERDMTVASFEIGGATHLWALGLCVLVGLGCIPYFGSGFKDCQHRCRHCGTLLATWHRSGHTEVHAHC